MNIFDSVVPLSDALFPPGSQDAHVQSKHVPGPRLSATDGKSFAAAANGFDNHIDPNKFVDPDSPNGPGEPISFNDRYSSVNKIGSSIAAPRFRRRSMDRKTGVLF